MCYVMLSRVQCLQQLNIIKDMKPEKITVDKTVMKEAERMGRCVPTGTQTAGWIGKR